MKTNRLILTILAAALAGCASPKPTLKLDQASASQPELLKPSVNPMAENSQSVARLHQPVKTMPVPAQPAAQRPVTDSSASVNTESVTPVQADDSASTAGGTLSVQQVDLNKAGTFEPITRVTNGVDAAQAAYVEGKRALGERQFDKAISLFRNARSLAPELVDAHAGLGVALSMAARHDEALSAFAKAVDLEPDNAQWHANLGLAYARTGKFLQAQQSLARAWSLKPGDARIESQLERVTAAARSAGVAPVSPLVPMNPATAQNEPAPTQLVQVRERVFDLNLNGAEPHHGAMHAPEPVAAAAAATAVTTPVRSESTAPAVVQRKARVLKFATAPESAAAVSDSVAGQAVADRINRTESKPIAKAPLTRSPDRKGPTVEKPVVRKPVAKAPAVEKPVVSKPVMNQPVANKPEVKAPLAKKPVLKSPPAITAVEKAAVKKVAVAKPVQAKTARVTTPKMAKAPVAKHAPEKAAVRAPKPPVAKKRVKSRKVRGMVVVAQSQVAGQRVVDFLSSSGLKAVRVGQPGGVRPLTEIHYRPGYERDVQDVRMAFPVRTYSVVQTNLPRGVNVQVVVGRDLQAVSGASVTDTVKR